MKKTLRIAVRQLVEYTLRSGDLQSGFAGVSRTVEAIQAHRKIQKSRPAEYLPEVPIAHQIETAQFFLEIGGRIDGVYAFPDHAIIEEIKTTTRSLEAFVSEEHQLHWGQAKIYAYVYALEHALEHIDIQLTYYHLDTKEIRESRKSFPQDDLKHFFEELIRRYIEWAATLEEWTHIRNTSIAQNEFPFPSYRQGQRQMAVAAYRAVKDGTQLLAQAPTGIGKTMAALFAVIKSLPEGAASKIFYLTARTTGKTAAEQALVQLRQRGLKLKSLTLTAKEKICFNPEKPCNGEECEFARGYYDRITQAVQESFRQDTFSREIVENLARTYQVCPFEFSLDLALWADCIICDYNYAFDPRVYLKRFFLEHTGDYTFLIDEAHNLVDRAREMFSAELRKQPFLDLRRAIKPKLPELSKIIGKINTYLLTARKTCAERSNPRSEKEPPEELYPLLRKFMTLSEQWLALNLKTAFQEELLQLYFAVNGFLRVAEQYNAAYATCFEKFENDVALKLFCIDPSAQLAEALKRCRSVIFFSATLTPLDYFREILGCQESARKLALPSPFPQEHLCLLRADKISTLYKARDRTRAEVARLILAAVSQKPGNYLIFFPSYEYLKKVYASFAEQVSDVESLLQTPGMTEPERDAFLARFTHDNPNTLVGFAGLGGIFGEGIDLVGDRLSGTVIVGVGLPGLSLERDLIREYFDHVRGSGFEYAYLYPGFNRVLQAAGRVIRTETDRGVVVLIDQRFATMRYASLFPREWQPMKVNNETQLRQILSTFWSV